MSDSDSDEDSPFYFELEVDDEISFKAPQRPQPPIKENSRSSFSMPQFSLRNLVTSSELFKGTVSYDKENVPNNENNKNAINDVIPSDEKNLRMSVKSAVSMFETLSSPIPSGKNIPHSPIPLGKNVPHSPIPLGKNIPRIEVTTFIASNYSNEESSEDSSENVLEAETMQENLASVSDLPSKIVLSVTTTFKECSEESSTSENSPDYEECSQGPAFSPTVALEDDVEVVNIADSQEDSLHVEELKDHSFLTNIGEITPTKSVTLHLEDEEEVEGERSVMEELLAEKEDEEEVLEGVQEEVNEEVEEVIAVVQAEMVEEEAVEEVVFAVENHTEEAEVEADQLDLSLSAVEIEWSQDNEIDHDNESYENENDQNEELDISLAAIEVQSEDVERVEEVEVALSAATYENQESVEHDNEIDKVEEVEEVDVSLSVLGYQENEPEMNVDNDMSMAITYGSEKSEEHVDNDMSLAVSAIYGNEEHINDLSISATYEIEDNVNNQNENKVYLENNQPNLSLSATYESQQNECDLSLTAEEKEELEFLEEEERIQMEEEREMREREEMREKEDEIRKEVEREEAERVQVEVETDNLAVEKEEEEDVKEETSEKEQEEEEKGEEEERTEEEKERLDISVREEERLEREEQGIDFLTSDSTDICDEVEEEEVASVDMCGQDEGENEVAVCAELEDEEVVASVEVIEAEVIEEVEGVVAVKEEVVVALIEIVEESVQIESKEEEEVAVKVEEVAILSHEVVEEAVVKMVVVEEIMTAEVKVEEVAVAEEETVKEVEVSIVVEGTETAIEVPVIEEVKETVEVVEEEMENDVMASASLDTETKTLLRIEIGDFSEDDISLISPILPILSDPPMSPLVEIIAVYPIKKCEIEIEVKENPMHESEKNNENEKIVTEEINNDVVNNVENVVNDFIIDEVKIAEEAIITNNSNNVTSNTSVSDLSIEVPIEQNVQKIILKNEIFLGASDEDQDWNMDLMANSPLKENTSRQVVDTVSSSTTPEQVEVQLEAEVAQVEVELSQVEVAAVVDAAPQAIMYTQEQLDETCNRGALLYLAREREREKNELALLSRVELSEAAVLSLSQQLSLQEKETITAKESSSLMGIQTRALAHRLQTLESELETFSKKKKEEITTLTNTHYTSITTLKTMMEDRENGLLREIESKTIVREDYLKGQLRESLGREENHAKEILEAVAAAKEKVYEKAKVQFEAGNKEFQKIKSLLKETKVERDASARQTETLSCQLSEARKMTEIETLNASIAGKRNSELRFHFKALVDFVEKTCAKSVRVAAREANCSDETSVTFAKDCIRGLCEDLQAALNSKTALQTGSQVLEKSLLKIEDNYIMSQIAVEQGKEKIAVLEALLTNTKIELTDTMKERDNQMTALATLLSRGPSSSPDLAASKAEIAELTERCANLRKMNEELLAMLEGMYEEKGKK